MAQEMTLQELLKNDEDKRSDHGGKSGERLTNGGGGDMACHSPAMTCSSRHAPTIAQSVKMCHREHWSVSSKIHFFGERLSRENQSLFDINSAFVPEGSRMSWMQALIHRLWTTSLCPSAKNTSLSLASWSSFTAIFQLWHLRNPREYI